MSCSPDMPENEATFAITAGGVADAKEWTIKSRQTHISSFTCSHFKLFKVFLTYLFIYLFIYSVL